MHCDFRRAPYVLRMTTTRALRRVTVWAYLNTHWGRQFVQGVASVQGRRRPWMLRMLEHSSELDSLAEHDLPDGLILPVWRPGEPGWGRDYGVPTVTVFAEEKPCRHPNLALDNEAVGRVGAAHLLATGAASYAFVQDGGRRADPVFSEPRCAGFVKEIESTGRSCRVLSFGRAREQLDPFTSQVGALPFARRLLDLPRPCAVMAPNDGIARLTALFCIRLGLRIPQDIAILGVDNDPALCRTTAPQLSSVRLPFAQIGADAARLLDRWLDGTPPPHGVTLYQPTDVAVRGSTSLHRVGDPVVAAALAYLTAHQGENVTVPALVAHTGVSRRTLEQRFKRALGHTPLMEIRAQRIAIGKRLLADTAAPIREVAGKSGFNSPERFALAFKELVGVSPSEYRRSRRP